MSEPLSRYYLQTMGIDSWVVRQPGSSVCENPLDDLAQEVAACQRCPLHKTRSQTVFSRGSSQAKLMIIGEAPGFYEDQQGLPFVGKAGSLLNQMIQSIGMTEEDVYIANVLKCRPPNNRDPAVEEIVKCSDYLTRQITLIKPDLILALGRFAGQFLVSKPLPLNQLRKTIHRYNDTPFIVSYHPAYLLRNPSDKKKAYIDLLAVKKYLMEKP
ncbi:uracil-DNA glycosylase, family 4 [Legionella massiliensis]|uniref:Type-4 uracil-DNA glycosylase n=1 Tax=Legionella massiliensis TaxID=1034943 RepID=A0A078KXN0_9GAMM|nr:uracil-DNA glycosylase [Legionella massiliensis]CDZ79170.1 uracil-DNA glycosylase, family 4 [Legionella massiliensis]CEE14908.1 Uracil DNA glycosylase superfamily protein [Legionella massiliensis]